MSARRVLFSLLFTFVLSPTWQFCLVAQVLDTTNVAVPPTFLEKPELKYPEEARAMGMEGWVGVAILVGETGTSESSKTVVVARDPPSPGSLMRRRGPRPGPRNIPWQLISARERTAGVSSRSHLHFDLTTAGRSHWRATIGARIEQCRMPGCWHVDCGNAILDNPLTT